MAVYKDFVFQRYGWTDFELGEHSGMLLDELQEVWQAEGEATLPKPQVAETHDELLAQARAQGFATTPEEYEQGMQQG